MPTLQVTTRQGETREIAAREGLSIMEAIQRAGVFELEAVCGGSCSCATCHIYLDPQFAGALQPQSNMEADLLATSEHQTAQSRLACQVVLTLALDGVKVRIAPQD